jgi:hypothetical protein
MLEFDECSKEAARNVILRVLAQALAGGEIDLAQRLADVRAQAWRETMSRLMAGMPGMVATIWEAQSELERRRLAECGWIYRRCSPRARLRAMLRGGGVFSSDPAWVDPNEVPWPELEQALQEEGALSHAVREAWSRLDKSLIVAAVRAGTLPLPLGVGGNLLLSRLRVGRRLIPARGGRSRGGSTVMGMKV